MPIIAVQPRTCSAENREDGLQLQNEHGMHKHYSAAYTALATLSSPQDQPVSVRLLFSNIAIPCDAYPISLLRTQFRPVYPVLVVGRHWQQTRGVKPSATRSPTRELKGCSYRIEPRIVCDMNSRPCDDCFDEIYSLSDSGMVVFVFRLPDASTVGMMSSSGRNASGVLSLISI